MKKKRIRNVIVISIVILIVSILYTVFNSITGIGLPCPIHIVFHVNCPGCGISRMIFSIFKLDFYQAFRYNPLLFILLPFIIILVVDAIKAYINSRETKIFSKIPMWFWIVMLVIVIGYGIIRNIEPFTFLSPTEVREKNTK